MIAQQNIRSAFSTPSSIKCKPFFLPDVLLCILKDALEKRCRHEWTKPEHEKLVQELTRQLFCLEQGDFEEAIQQLAALIRRDNEPLAYLMLAGGYMMLDEEHCALTILDILLHSEPEYEEACLMQAVYLRSLNRRSEARKEFLRVVQWNPRLHLGWCMLIEMAVEENDPVEAARLLKEALAYDVREDHGLMRLERMLLDQKYHGAGHEPASLAILPRSDEESDLSMAANCTMKSN
jgi:predicted Zn-dependent protease